MARGSIESPDVLILGAGLAGLAAGLRLVDRGMSVTVLETRKQPGGRAGSFDHHELGLTLDNCQHVMMGCCFSLRRFLDRLGVSDQIDWHEALYFADSDGRVQKLSPAPLPAPLHFLPALLRWRALGWIDCWRIGLAMHVLRRLTESQHRALDRLSFHEWLRQHSQTQRAIRRFWEPVIVSACNEQLDRVSARYAAQVMREAFMGQWDHYKLGVPRVPLRTLYQPAVDQIRAGGGRVQFGESVEQLHAGQDGLDGVVTSRGFYQPRFVISALPFERLCGLVDEPLAKRDPRVQQACALNHSPIIGIHLLISCEEDQPVFPWPYLALLESPLHWIFGKGSFTRPHGRRVQYLHGVISGAHAIVQQRQDAIRHMAVDQLERVTGRAVHDRVEQALVVKERRATFAAEAGVDQYRPMIQGPLANLLLAGDWVATGWPATMEGAVRSGEAAAEAVGGR